MVKFWARLADRQQKCCPQIFFFTDTTKMLSVKLTFSLKIWLPSDCSLAIVHKRWAVEPRHMQSNDLIAPLHLEFSSLQLKLIWYPAEQKGSNIASSSGS